MTKKHRNLRKAAILVASLDDSNAQNLLRQMSSEQAQLLREAMATLGEIDPAEQQEVVEEFFRIGPLVPAKQPSGIELDGRLPKHLAVSSARRELPRSRELGRHAAVPFKFLDDASNSELIQLLEREHPQTIAVVISHLTQGRAAETLAGLTAELQTDVARRLVDLDETDPEILRDVENGLETWLGERMHTHRRRAAGISALTNILEAATPQAKQHLLANLTQHDRQLAGKLRAVTPRELTYAEVEQLDKGSLAVLLRQVDVELLVLALFGASTEFVERALGLLPAPRAAYVRRSLTELGPIRLADVEHAQAALAELAGQLATHGEIVPKVRGQLSVAV